MTGAPLIEGGGGALVTGACGGLGRELVRVLLDAGASPVYAACRRAGEHRWPEEDADRLVPVGLDVAAPIDGDALARRCAGVRILVNSAGVNANRALFGADPEAVVEAATAEVETNYLGLLRVTLALADVLSTNQPSTVVNILSTSGRVPLPPMATYSASKAAAVSISDTLRAELGPRGVRVVNVLPALFDSQMSATIDLPKPTARAVAEAIVAGIAAGDERIYPEPMSAGFAAAFAVGDEAVAAQLAAVVAGASG